MSTVIIIGSGPIGVGIAKSLIKQHKEVHIVDDTSSQSMHNIAMLKNESLGDKFTHSLLDYTCEHELSKVFQCHRVEAVYLCIELITPKYNSPAEVACSYLKSISALILAMKQHKIFKLILGSTRLVEISPAQSNQLSIYSQVHKQTELLLENIANVEPLWRILSMRLSPICRDGNHEMIDDALKAISSSSPKSTIKMGFNSKDGSQFSSFLAFEDAIEVYVKALDYLDVHIGWDTLDVYGESFTALELHGLIACISKKSYSLNYSYQNNATGEPTTVNNSKSKALLNWHRKVSLSNEISRRL